MTDVVAREKRWHVQVISVVSRRTNIILKEIIIVRVTQTDLCYRELHPTWLLPPPEREAVLGEGYPTGGHCK